MEGRSPGRARSAGREILVVVAGGGGVGGSEGAARVGTGDGVRRCAVEGDAEVGGAEVGGAKVAFATLGHQPAGRRVGCGDGPEVES